MAVLVALLAGVDVLLVRATLIALAGFIVLGRSGGGLLIVLGRRLLRTSVLVALLACLDVPMWE